MCGTRHKQQRADTCSAREGRGRAGEPAQQAAAGNKPGGEHGANDTGGLCTCVASSLPDRQTLLTRTAQRCTHPGSAPHACTGQLGPAAPAGPARRTAARGARRPPARACGGARDGRHTRRKAHAPARGTSGGGHTQRVGRHAWQGVHAWQCRASVGWLQTWGGAGTGAQSGAGFILT